jgi:trehalose 6-phosphate synthase
MPAELVVVSNRGPFSFDVAADGGLQPRQAGGGLAPSLAAALERRAFDGDEAVWVAAAMTDGDRVAAASGVPVSGDGHSVSVRLVVIEEEVWRAAYDVIANATLWFVLHGLYDAARRPVIDRRWFEAWEKFRAYNAQLAETTAEVAAEGAVVLVNDYHLLLMGSMLSKLRPDLKTVHFTHTPFASVEELAMLPSAVGREIVEGLAGFGACGFHTDRWRAAFLRSAQELGVEPPQTFSQPLGPDIARLREVADSPECDAQLRALEGRLDGRLLLLRSDRVELSKNILRGLWAFDTLLAEHAQWRGRVVHVVRAYASREGLAEYLAYRAEAEHLAAVINERWSAPGYQPVVVDVEDDFASTVAALRRYDTLLVNPVRDGLNLVAKEGPVLNENHGTLVLSENAGAYGELAGACLGVNPFDVVATADALHEALSAGPEIRSERAERLAKAAAANSPSEWLAVLLSRAAVSRLS